MIPSQIVYENNYFNTSSPHSPSTLNNRSLGLQQSEFENGSEAEFIIHQLAVTVEILSLSSSVSAYTSPSVRGRLEAEWYRVAKQGNDMKVKRDALQDVFKFMSAFSTLIHTHNCMIYHMWLKQAHFARGWVHTDTQIQTVTHRENRSNTWVINGLINNCLLKRWHFIFYYFDIDI